MLYERGIGSQPALSPKTLRGKAAGAMISSAVLSLINSRVCFSLRLRP